MKRIFILLAAVALVAAGCKNYDDRFDDLNNQITALQGQVNTLQGLSSTVTALQTTITGIRESVKEDINTAVAGVNTSLGTTLTNAQQLLNTRIDGVSASVSKDLTAALTKVQTDLQGEIKKLEGALASQNESSKTSLDELNKKLETAQNALLAIDLKGLETQLADLKRELDEARNTALSAENLGEITSQINVIREKLDESIEASNRFVIPNVTISNRGSWRVVQEEHKNATRFQSDLSIHTADLSSDEIKAVAEWVKNISLVLGTLEIRHTDKENVIKFESLTNVGTLDDTQPHVHYPELIEATKVTLNGDKNKILTVKLPKLTSTEFAGNKIDLPEADEITLGIEKYNAALTIEADEDETTVEINALKELDSNGANSGGEQQLSINGAGEVSLSELRKLSHLHLKNVESVTAPKVKGAILTIGEDVEEVKNVGTAEDSHINNLRYTVKDNQGNEDGGEELKVLQIGGNSTSDSRFRTEVKSDDLPDLRTAHIHGAYSVIIEGQRFEEIITGRTIPTLHLIGTDVEGDVELGHKSGAGSVLRIEGNGDLERLTADNVNQLKTLIIQGNPKLERVSFAALKEGSPQKFGTPNWYDGDRVEIGRIQVHPNPESDAEVEEYGSNKLFADEIHLRVPNNQAGKITDSSGLSGLKEFLSHENIRRALVSYDGANTFKPIRGTTFKNENDKDETTNSDDDENNFVLIRKGLRSTDVGARRVFLVSGITDVTTPLSIRAGGGTKEINLTNGGTYNNWASDVNDDEVKNFFDSNGVTISARAGGYPRGTITVKPKQDADNNDLPLGSTGELTGSLKLTIEDNSQKISSTVTVYEIAAPPAEGETLDDGEITQADFNKKAVGRDANNKRTFAGGNKHAVTYVTTADIDPDTDGAQALDDNTADLETIRNLLIKPFTIYNGTDEDSARDGAPLVDYGINDFGADEANSDGAEEIADVAIIGILDAQAIDKAIKVDIKSTLGDRWNLAKPSKTNIDNRKSGNPPKEDTLQITLTSQTAGDGEDSAIDQPKNEGNNAGDFALPRAPGTSSSIHAGVSGAGVADDNRRELPIHKRDRSTNNIEIKNYRNSSLPRKGADVDSFGGNKDLDRLGWIG